MRSFNPRVRAGRDFNASPDVKFKIVSIHASARDATTDALGITDSKRVSIHASARDATRRFPAMT